MNWYVISQDDWKKIHERKFYPGSLKKKVNLTNLGSQYDHDKLTAQKQPTDLKAVILTTFDLMFNTVILTVFEC